MKAAAAYPRRFWAPPVLVWGVASFLCHCNGAKQSPLQAAGPPPRTTLGITNPQSWSSVPNTPTAANVSIAPAILRACNIPDTDAYFPFDSSQLTGFDHVPLDALAMCFTQGPMKGRKLQLVGHADPRGTLDYNVTLGQSRADAVKGYLNGGGLDADQLTTTSRGAMDATGRDEPGWAHDRRVDILLAP